MILKLIVTDLLGVRPKSGHFILCGPDLALGLLTIPSHHLCIALDDVFPASHLPEHKAIESIFKPGGILVGVAEKVSS